MAVQGAAMNELPDVGDFGRVVQGCACGGMDDCIGEIALVTSITGDDWACDCPGCHRMIVGELAHSPQWMPGTCYPRQWMRKLPPDRAVLEELEREAVPA